MENSEIDKIIVDVQKLREIFEEHPKKKKMVQNVLNIDRSVISKVLNNKRKLEGGELLTIAHIFDINPFDLSLGK